MQESDRKPDNRQEKRRKNAAPAGALAREAILAAQEKKAEDIVILDMRAASGLADYFVLCTGSSDLQVKAIVESIELRLKEEFAERPWHAEGTEHRRWVLLDYVDLVVHVFSPDRRAFYDLERLWSDAPTEAVGYGPIAMLSP